MDAGERTGRTYRLELWRAGAAGMAETAGSTFLLLIAVRAFSAGAVAKSLVAAGGSVGLLLSPLVVSHVAARQWRAARAAAAILGMGAVAFLAGAVFPVLGVFVLCGVVGTAASGAIIPLLTQIYQDNYPAHERGQRFSRTVMVRIAASVVFSKVAGDALTGHLNYFPLLLVAFALALGLGSFCLARCPSRPIAWDGGTHPLRALRFAREDRVFGWTLVCWMLLGFANLMMLPLRVEYLANPVYGQEATVGMIALVTGVVPNLARLVLSPVWGHLFDRMNFFALRITLNLGFAAGILTFFLSDSLPGMLLGAVVYGISNSGGDVAWGLWVTKFAPPDRVADYMSVHTFLTGVRGVLAPMLGYMLLTQLPLLGLGVSPLVVLAGLSSLLIVAASLMLVPELRRARRPSYKGGLAREMRGRE